MSKRFDWVGKVNWLLVAIVALALGLRLWNIDFGLPYTVAPDTRSD